MAENKELRTARQAAWEKENVTRVQLKFVNNTDTDVIKKLEKSGNKQGYIKSLIRADIAKEISGGDTRCPENRLI